MGAPLKLKHSAADPVRLSFPDLWTATEFEPGSKKRFNANLIVKKGGANDAAVQAAILAAATEAFDGKTAKAQAFINANQGNSNKFCYTSGDAKEYDGYAGNMILSAHRPADQGRPGIFDCTRAGPDGKPMALQEDSGKPYAGSYVNFSGEIWIQQGKYPGVRCGMSGVFFANDGDHFSGGKTAAADEFDVSEGADAADDLA